MAPKINPKLQCQKIGYFFRENSKASQFKSWNMLSCIHSWLYSKFFKSVQERSNSWLYLHVRVLIGADFRSVGHFHTFLFHKRTINILLIDVLDHWLVVIAAQILRIQLNTFGYIWHLQITYIVVIIDPDPGFPPGTCGGLSGSVSNAVNHDAHWLLKIGP